MATLVVSRPHEISFLKRFTNTLTELSRNLMGTSSLVPPAVAARKKVDNPFGNFGVIASAEKFKANAKPIVKSSVMLTIEDARKRISEFVENKFKPESLSELKEYLADRFLRLETWKLSPGPMNMLVDTKTSAATPAAAVDKRLSYLSMLEERLKGDLRREIGNTKPVQAFGSWEGMAMALSNSRGNIGYTVSRGQAYLGKVFAEPNDVRSIHEIVEAAKAANVQIILPTEDGTINGRRIPGLPVLKKLETLKAELVHSGLSHNTLAEAFGGMGLAETMESKVKAKRTRDSEMFDEPASDRNFDLSDFMGTAQKDSFPIVNDDPHTSSFGDFADQIEDSQTRNLSLRMYSDDSSELVVYDRDFDEETQIQFSDMPTGRYERENVHGVVEGYTEILDDGALKHYDMRGIEVEISKSLENDDVNRDNDLPKYGRN